MAEITRGERTVQLFALLISNPSRAYTINDLMAALEIPENERRNVQRDMNFLASINGGAYIRVSGDRRAYLYQSAIKSADNLLFPNFENTMLHFVFLQRIANMYPAASETVTDLLEKIQKSLPSNEKKAVEQLAQDLNSRILFAGTPPMFEEDSSEKLKVILRAIHERRKILVTYISETGNIPHMRIPLMVILYQGEIYIGCESQSHPGETYTLKFRRIQKVELTKETFQDNPKTLEMLRKRVQLGSAIFGPQDPNAEDVEIIFKDDVQAYLEERPFQRSMKVEKLRNGRLLVTMKALNDDLLFRWVLSYADSAEVIKPISLRKKLRDFSFFLDSTYRQNPWR
ncbi:WYL domain-containing protein [Fibrobacter sp. UWB10]|uniref:helix-turn-helix transcriptional regulator n=1 Tax=Fibrobacter sp. UWB10 TaxID=1896201 RepID=UPI00240337F1|nr:WYL domain-containing protein [Fibrobacter sp. UWB10]SMP51507.1 Predicted DNA-binding transcriptional regulator YafY, contains an HTH and WYL domains [Fibrobacter sp. UWB10]